MENNLEKRKIQLVGGYSFLIALPKEWAKLVNLTKEDTIEIEITEDKNLLIKKTEVQNEQNSIVS